MLTMVMSHQSTSWVVTPVIVPHDPTADVVQFAFMPTATQVPITSDWVPGAWQAGLADFLFPFQAGCLVGPAGAVTLGLGRYVVYVKVIDSPEVPVLMAGTLTIT